ncbi:hypothetical protein BHM03_00056825, partial [Ensete ventricosum]
EFQSIFRSSSQKFKILAIPNVLAHGKSYEYGFTKNTMVINFAQSRVSISFSSIVSEIQNSSYSQCICT